MSAIARRLGDREIDALAAFLSGGAASSTTENTGD
jgi:hypothetical protein